MEDKIKFFKNLFNALNNRPGVGYSVKKCLAVATFLLMAYPIIRYTNAENLLSISVLLSSLLTTLVAANIVDKKTVGKKTDDKTDNPVI